LIAARITSSSLLSVIVGAVMAMSPTPASAAGTALSCDGRWQVVPSSNHSQLIGEIDSLNSVAALSSGDQWAVGYWLHFPEAYTFHTLVEHWDGSSTGWTVVPSPNSLAINSYLNGVAAIAPNDVWAVGGTDQSGPPYQSLVEHWDGSSWSIVSRASFPGVLYGVIALGADNIWAVGNRDYPGSALIEHWDGTAWTATYLRTNASLRGVTASAANDVWAVGYAWGLTGIDAGIETTFTTHFNGHVWVNIPSPSPLTRHSEDQNWLTSVTAAAANDIWAVGWDADFALGITGRTLIEHWDGSHWRVVGSPNPPAQAGGSSDADSLWGVAAVGRNDVWAVGSIGGTLDFSASTLPLIARWNGSGWAAVDASPNQSGQLMAVAAEPGGSGVSATGHADTTVFVSTLAQHVCPG
jgi:hypothetical protein